MAKALKIKPTKMLFISPKKIKSNRKLRKDGWDPRSKEDQNSEKYIHFYKKNFFNSEERKYQTFEKIIIKSQKKMKNNS